MTVPEVLAAYIAIGLIWAVFCTPYQVERLSDEPRDVALTVVLNTVAWPMSIVFYAIRLARNE